MAASTGAGQNVEKRLEIEEVELKHGRPIRKELIQILHNTEWFTRAQLTINLQTLNQGRNAIVLINGKENDVEIACNLVLRRLKANFGDNDLPNGVSRLTMENLKKHNQSDVARRQFACTPCDSIWWTYVLQYKPVSRCKRCNTHYKAIPRESEYGWALHICPSCGNRFIGWSQRGVGSPCHRCSTVCYPDKFDVQKNRRRQGRAAHACQHCDFGRIQPCPMYRKVILGSEVHIETGSTADTFITQMTFA